MSPSPSSRSGLALILALFFATLLVFTAVLVATLVMRTHQISSSVADQSNAFYLAEGARELGLQRAGSQPGAQVLSPVYPVLEAGQQVGDFTYDIQASAATYPSSCDPADTLTYRGWGVLEQAESVIIPLFYTDAQGSTPSVITPFSAPGGGRLLAHVAPVTPSTAPCLAWDVRGTAGTSGTNATESVAGHASCQPQVLDVLAQTGTYKPNPDVSTASTPVPQLVSAFVQARPRSYFALANLGATPTPVRYCLQATGGALLGLPTSRVEGIANYRTASQTTVTEGDGASGSGWMPLLNWNWFNTL